MSVKELLSVDFAPVRDGQRRDELIGAGEHVRVKKFLSVLMEANGKVGLGQGIQGLFWGDKRNELAIVTNIFVIPIFVIITIHSLGNQASHNGHVDDAWAGGILVGLDKEAVLDLAQVDAVPAEFDLLVAGDSTVELELASR
jgi:hypothetical protein